MSLINLCLKENLQQQGSPQLRLLVTVTMSNYVSMYDDAMVNGKQILYILMETLLWKYPYLCLIILLTKLRVEIMKNLIILRQQPFSYLGGGPGIFWKKYCNALADRFFFFRFCIVAEKIFMLSPARKKIIALLNLSSIKPTTDETVKQQIINISPV